MVSLVEAFGSYPHCLELVIPKSYVDEVMIWQWPLNFLFGFGFDRLQFTLVIVKDFFVQPCVQLICA